MRPAGEIRAALLGVPATHGPCTLHKLVEHSQVGYSAALYTVKNLVRSGVLVKVGRERVAHARRWVAVYDLATPGPMDEQQAAGSQVLAMSLRTWCQTPPLEGQAA